jgi:hypothetical protein
MQEDMRFKLSTRILHISMILVVSYQLLSSLWMAVPEPGKLHNLGNTLFSLHITIFGWASIIVSGVYALTRFYESEAWGRLVPWFSSHHRRVFFKSAQQELPQMFKGKLAAPEGKGALAGAVHGFGFLALLGMGMSGLYVLFGVRLDGNLRDDIQFVLHIHEWFGILIWAFLGAHVFLSICHLLVGQISIMDIFRRGQIRWK